MLNCKKSQQNIKRRNCHTYPYLSSGCWSPFFCHATFCWVHLHIFRRSVLQHQAVEGQRTSRMRTEVHVQGPWRSVKWTSCFVSIEKWMSLPFIVLRNWLSCKLCICCLLISIRFMNKWIRKESCHILLNMSTLALLYFIRFTKCCNMLG